ncbi:hypothetical protein ACODM8_14005 [Vibrio ostreicida]
MSKTPLQQTGLYLMGQRVGADGKAIGVIGGSTGLMTVTNPPLREQR